MKYIIVFLVLSAFTILLIAQISGEDTLPAPEQKELQQALTAWNKYGDFLSHCEGNVVEPIKWYDEDGSVVGVETSFSELICDYPNCIHKFHIDQEKPRISGFNKDYTFEIIEGKNGLFSVESVKELNAPPQHFSWEYRNWDDGGLQILNWKDTFISDTFATAFDAAGFPLPALIIRSDFAVTEVQNVIDSEKNKVRISFTFSPRLYTPSLPVRGGIIDLMPDSCWLPDRMELYLTNEDGAKSGKTPYVEIYQFEYQYDYAMPLLKKAYRETTLNGQLFWNSVTDYDLKYVKHGKYPKKRFTLSYYGLPEPDFVKKKFTLFRCFLFAFGLGILSLSAWQLRRNWRRYQNKGE